MLRRVPRRHDDANERVLLSKEETKKIIITTTTEKEGWKNYPHHRIDHQAIGCISF